jgi:RNA ligase (TIGR02306 family)
MSSESPDAMSAAMPTPTLAIVGRITVIGSIPEADFVDIAIVTYGDGDQEATWTGIVSKDKFQVGQLCTVFLQDAQIPTTLEELKFMEKFHYRVSMRRFKGVASECLIASQLTIPDEDFVYNRDVTSLLGVTKYEKSMEEKFRFGGDGVGFPSHVIDQTDEPNFQSAKSKMHLYLFNQPCVITLKYDGTSTTIYRTTEESFGVCSRKVDIRVPTEDNIYWKIANKYDLRNKLRPGIAIQLETCGPKIQKNPHQLKEITAFLFTAIDIATQTYFSFAELEALSKELNIPLVHAFRGGNGEEYILPEMTNEELRLLAEELAVHPDTKKPLEGIVIRPAGPGKKGVKESVKVLNLKYKH